MKLTNAIKSAVPAAVLGVLTLGLISTPAAALTQTATIAVSATVVDSCSISANSLGFGTYAGAALPASTTITVTCTNLGSYQVGLNGGTTTGGTDVARIMQGPGLNVLNYNLYTTAGLATVWGNTAAHNWVVGTGTGSAQTLTVYGNVTAAQPLAVGSYSDSITATVNY